jgi:Ca-activated chloride channel homolog
MNIFSSINMTSLNMVEFTYPWAFVLVISPLLILWLAPSYKEKKSSIKVPYFARLVDITGETPQNGAVVLNRNNIQRLLIGFSWLCIITSMAKPVMIGDPISLEKSARDLMIAVDLSGSMAVEDFTLSTPYSNQVSDAVNHSGLDSIIKVDRLVAVKSVLNSFSKNREHDRLGLILFGDAPYLQAPFTDDIDTWQALLEETAIGMAGQSTAFGDAIGLAISVFEQSETKNRVLIVLTDGNDTASKVPPVEAAKVAAAHNIKIYTIAIGDPTAVGEEKVDLEVLSSMAKITQGKMFQALNHKELQQVYQEIDKLEPQQFDSLSFRPKTSIHHYPIIAFVSLYLFFLFIINSRIRWQLAVQKRKCCTEDSK